MKRLLIVFNIIIGLGCGLAACGLQPDPTLTPTPTLAATRTPKILFSDDFEADEDANGWWLKIEPEKGLVSRDNGSLKLQADKDNIFIWSIPEKFEPASSVVIRVDAEKVDGSENNLFGVICRYQDEKNFYFFVISSDGHFGIGKVKEGKYSLINRYDYPPNENIKKGEAKNVIEVKCISEVLWLVVNGVDVDLQQDSDFKTGKIGFIVGAVKNNMTAVSFDNLEVTGP